MKENNLYDQEIKLLKDYLKKNSIKKKIKSIINKLNFEVTKINYISKNEINIFYKGDEENFNKIDLKKEIDNELKVNSKLNFNSLYFFF